MKKQSKDFNKNAGLSSKNNGINADMPRMNYRSMKKGNETTSSLHLLKTKVAPAHPKNVLRLSDSESHEVIAGKRAMDKTKVLQNNGAMKRVLNSYIKRSENFISPKASYKRRNFVPFVEERDHLGQLIDSDVRTELGSSTQIKKLLVKKGDRLEIREDVPRRWLEQVGAASEINPINTARGSLNNMDAYLAVNKSHGNLKIGPYKTGGNLSPYHNDHDTTLSENTSVSQTF